MSGLLPERNSMKLAWTIFQISMLLLSNSIWAQGLDEIGYFQPSTIVFDWEDLSSAGIGSSDSIGEGAVQIFRNSKGLPLFYWQDIFTSVCFDNQCRPLSLKVYWNVTGRYLGFRLPAQEFLSRYDHEPFAQGDYEQLNSLLADPYLPLGNIAFQELIEHSEDSLQQIDGVSGATPKRILNYVVEGAAYTTYTMWNIIYGPTKKVIERQTEQEMTSELLTQILQSPNTEDKTWGLARIDQTKELDTLLVQPLIELISFADFFVAYSAIEMISPIQLKSENFQLQLFSAYADTRYSLKGEILKKLASAPMISRAVIQESHNILNDLNGEQLGYMLELYEKQSITDMQTAELVAALLQDDNTFISKKAFDYLSQINELPDDIVQSIRSFAVSQQ